MLIRALKFVEPIFAAMGVNWLLAAGRKQQGILNFTVTSAGTPDVVLFATYANVDADEIAEMADTDYQVLVNGETAGAVSVDESTKTVSGFSILGGGAGEKLHVIVAGRLKNMPVK